MRLSLPLLALAALLFAAPAYRLSAASLDGLAVEVMNDSEPVLCAEKDNVAVTLASPDVRSFRVEAAHPAYLSPGGRNNWEADWTACDMSADPSFVPPAAPRKVTLYEETGLWIIGYTYGNFWRPATATVRIGERTEKGLHLLQVWWLRTDGSEEVLVLYPQDGYWRARPLSPTGLRNTAYGSSFLIGPIEIEGRPLVKIREVVFEPKSRTFSLDFEKGGSAKVRLASVDDNRLALDVAFDRAIGPGPFASLRSMYVTEFNNDAARIAVREQGAKGWREENIMKFDRAKATDVWIGRLSPSQHNTTSPDFVFNSFSDGPNPKRPKSEPPDAAKVAK